MPKVMVVEDDSTMSELLQTLLSFEGYQVVGLDEYDGVVENIAREQPDVVFMDVNLRDVSGLDLLEQLRSRKNLGRVPVIMTSGMERSQEALEKGADDFILKPFMPDELIQKIKNILKN